MFAIVGAAGRVGYSTSLALRKAGQPVRAILRDATKAARLREIGCEIALADLQDAGSLAQVIDDVDAVQLIVPVSPTAPDPAGDMRRSIQGIAKALDQARPKRVLAISDYGAHVADDIGMPSVFRELETRLTQIDSHLLVLRSAEHVHNWSRVIPRAVASGDLMTFQDPVDMTQPTISAQDLGVIAADLLLRPDSGNNLEVIHAEGPRRYSASDVATAVSQLSGRLIHARAVPRSQWKEVFERTVPATLADLLIKANDAKNMGGLIDIEPNAGEVRRGTTELIDALRPLSSPE
ncbi:MULTISPECIES: NAD(P)H-binding protein [unclassified Rhizobium]|uniref:NmrA family NAD(P)-binding protein n=1 Tax=unclassified Rhizobium TaxID=2613769 RepID=UPI001A9A1333|nr:MULTISPECIES: NAD(P)H-binding protein [unclassified Rhizobium]MBX5174464.1 NAD(P)H-binding protein [Rhizobium sp. NZLR1b]MBX5193642.1 NAD(P)H-binding protein [Rhizobium sp. NZLR3b]MBX5204179.1 NAD(P)H-binding protein [Rhizobium sp. NZLR1]MBX5212291.1 NAD(P)H-binding protein [Rhizobium sp. NZLR11]QSZ25252.1 NAD(P)H-binding protein [Rhizobium sp. NZLR1]